MAWFFWKSGSRSPPPAAHEAVSGDSTKQRQHAFDNSPKDTANDTQNRSDHLQDELPNGTAADLPECGLGRHGTVLAQKSLWLSISSVTGPSLTNSTSM